MKSADERVHYTYVHRRKTDGRVFYVGKGKGRRAWSMDRKNIHWRRIEAKHGFSVQIVLNRVHEPCALTMEKILISAIGRDNLTNLTDGGEGATGYFPPPHVRKKMSLAKKGKPRGPTPEWVREKIRKSHMGLRPTKEALRKMSLAKIGKNAGRDGPTYDHKVRSFLHIDGYIFTGTRADFITEFQLAHGCVSSLISGRRKTVKGWTLK